VEKIRHISFYWREMWRKFAISLFLPNTPGKIFKKKNSSSRFTPGWRISYFPTFDVGKAMWRIFAIDAPHLFGRLLADGRDAYPGRAIQRNPL
jgi:hypothetical protein